jgi:hypothetical protein
MKKDLHRRRAGGAGDHSVPMPVEETAAPEGRSTRSFGEYAFLEDSRYASQTKNVSV